MFRMTKKLALEIQAQHVDAFAEIYGEDVRKLVADATTADALPDGEHDIVLINRHIPRGGAIEQLIPVVREREARYQSRQRGYGDEIPRRRKGIY